MGRNISDKLRIGDWIKIPLTVEPETYLKLDESNVGYYNKLKKEIIGSGPRKVNVIEVKKYYENKIKEHMEEASLANRFAEVYRYKDLMGVEDSSKNYVPTYEDWKRAYDEIHGDRK